MNEHVVYVLNGNYYDSWDSGKRNEYWIPSGYEDDGHNRSMANYENNRSNHSISDRMIASLEQQMNMAQTDYERQQILAEIKHIRENQNK